MAAVHHLGFVGGSFGTIHESPFIVAIPRKNLIMIGSVFFKLNVFEIYVVHG